MSWSRKARSSECTKCKLRSLTLADLEHTKSRNVSYNEYTKPSFGYDSWSEFKYLFQDGEWQVFEVEREEEETA